MHSLKLEEGEKIILEVRKHIFIFYAETFGLFIFAILPLLFISYADSFLSRFNPGEGGQFFAALYCLWFLACWIIFFTRWTDYYLDVWVITNKRIFDIEQIGLFHRNISAFRLDRIQDITVEVKGVIATFLKFGNVRVHTAGENSDLLIKSALDPMSVKESIMGAQRDVLETKTTL